MTNNLTPRPEVRGAIVGVDTHKHIHVAVAIDTCGIHLGDQSFAADSGGYQALLTWAETHGRIEAFGIEGTGGYGVGLARAVRRAGHRVVEVNRADRRLRRVAGKSDRIDAEAAARSVLAGQATATPKTADGAVEMIRQLKVGSGRPGSLLTLAPHRSGRAGSAASGSSTDSFATRRRVPAGPGSQAMATAIPKACLASSAIRCRDVETGPNLGVLAVFPSTGATCRCPLPSTGSRGLNSPASAVL